MKYFLKLTQLTIIVLLTFISSAIVMFTCGPKPVEITINTPYSLTAEAKNSSAIIRWKINRKNDSPIGGYNIYLAVTSDTEGNLYNSGPYPGDTDGDNTCESIELTRLDNGREYFVYIRTVLSDGSLSEPSAKVSFMPLARGRIEISQNHTTKQSGYNFAKMKSSLARDFDNDLYIYANKGKVGMSSPSRLHSSLRKTLIKIENDSESKFEQSQQLVKGKTYLLKTADGGSVRLNLMNLPGKEPNLKAVFDFVYYPPGIKP